MVGNPKEKRIDYVKPEILDLGAMIPAHGGACLAGPSAPGGPCEDGGGAATGQCNTGSNDTTLGVDLLPRAP